MIKSTSSRTALLLALSMGSVMAGKTQTSRQSSALATLAALAATRPADGWSLWGNQAPQVEMEPVKYVCIHPADADPTGLLHYDPCCTAPRISPSEGDTQCTGYSAGKVIERALVVLKEMGTSRQLAPGFDHMMFNTACKDGAIEGGYAANGDEVRNLSCPSELVGAQSTLGSGDGMQHFTRCDEDQCTRTYPWRSALEIFGADEPELAQRLISVRQGECSDMIDQRDYTTPEKAQHCQRVWTDALQPTVRILRNIISTSEAPEL